MTPTIRWHCKSKSCKKVKREKMKNRRVIDDIFGTEEEVRSIVQKNLPAYLLHGLVQPQTQPTRESSLYIMLTHPQTNETALYLLKPLPYDKHQRGKETIKTMQSSPYKTKEKTDENYLQLHNSKEYQNVA